MPEQDAMTTFHVDSEVGILRRVLLHRPDLELRRLTPRNCADLLFDDVLWVKRARQEHDAFADTLADRGVEVLYVDDLLAETLKDDRRPPLAARPGHHRRRPRSRAGRGRSAPSSTRPTPTTVGHPSHRWPHRRRAARTARLATACAPTSSVPKGFVLPPLPNHLFTRDTTVLGLRRCVTQPDGQAGPPSGDRPPRGRSTASTRCSPTSPSPPGTAASTHDLGSATIEGGDVLVIGNGAVLIGMGERTTPQAVEAHWPAGSSPPRRGRQGHRRRPARAAGVHAPRHRHDHGPTTTPSSPTPASSTTCGPGRSRPATDRRGRRHRPARCVHVDQGSPRPRPTSGS